MYAEYRATDRVGELLRTSDRIMRAIRLLIDCCKSGSVVLMNLRARGHFNVF